jgi:crossover junction endodeoxyribonuclease RusA
MTDTLALTYRAPTIPLSENEARGQHWAKVAERLDPWKTATWVTTRNAITQNAVPWEGSRPHQAITVQVSIPFRTNRRRDAHNYTGTIVKAVVDGLVKAGLVPDDTPEWVTVLDPVLTVVGPIPAVATVTVTITRRDTTP